MNSKTVCSSRFRALAMGLTASLTTSAGLAHDFWIQPSTFQSPVDSAVTVELRVGDGFPGDVVARNDSRIGMFSMTGPEGEKPIIGQDGSKSAGVIRPQKAGLHILAYRGKPAFIKLEAEKFEAYLKEEGLDDIIKIRKKKGESEKEGTETYSRCAKSLMQVGEPSTGEEPLDRAVGLRLELVATANPATLKPGEELSVQLLFDGKPIANRMIFAKSADHADAKVSAKTDDKGMVKLKLAKPGMWLITSVLMTDAPNDNAHGAQWESLWASLTLQVPKSK